MTAIVQPLTHAAFRRAQKGEVVSSSKRHPQWPSIKAVLTFTTLAGWTKPKPGAHGRLYPQHGHW
jgi:hypothetical protein